MYAPRISENSFDQEKHTGRGIRRRNLEHAHILQPNRKSPITRDVRNLPSQPAILVRRAVLVAVISLSPDLPYRCGRMYQDWLRHLGAGRSELARHPLKFGSGVHMSRKDGGTRLLGQRACCAGEHRALFPPCRST